MDLDPPTATLHQKMRDLSISRQNRTLLWKTVKWALYTEQHFKDLVEYITSLTNDLVELLLTLANRSYDYVARRY
jgi:hypothetical protein